MPRCTSPVTTADLRSPNLDPSRRSHRRSHRVRRPSLQSNYSISSQSSEVLEPHEIMADGPASQCLGVIGWARGRASRQHLEVQAKWPHAARPAGSFPSSEDATSKKSRSQDITDAKQFFQERKSLTYMLEESLARGRARSPPLGVQESHVGLILKAGTAQVEPDAGDIEDQRGVRSQDSQPCPITASCVRPRDTPRPRTATTAPGLSIDCSKMPLQAKRAEPAGPENGNVLTLYHDGSAAIQMFSINE